MKQKTVKAVIWKKSIHDNNFFCTRCGRKLWNINHAEPTGNFHVYGDVVCCGCGYEVATVKSVSERFADSSAGGNFADAMREYAERSIAETEQKLKDATADIVKLTKRLEELTAVQKRKDAVYEERIKEQRKTIEALSRENNALNRELLEMERKALL